MTQIKTGRLALVPDQTNTHFSIRDLTDNQVRGTAGLDAASGKIYISVDMAARRMGYGMRAAKALVWYAFEVMEMVMVWVRVAPDNAAGCRLLEKLGFVEAAGEWRLYHTDRLPGPDWSWREMTNPEKMGAFFDVRADGYDEHMFSFGGGASYAKLEACIPETADAVRILDIGCGTGIELDSIWRHAPNAHITCVDLSRGMLDLLIENHRQHLNQIAVVEASYVDWAYPKEAFDLVISSNTMHHFWETEKVGIYKKVLSCLKPGGAYIENDFIVDEWWERQYRKRYNLFVDVLGRTPKGGEFHIDIPFTIKRQTRLLVEAGFKDVVVLDDNVQPNWSTAILKSVRD